MSLSDLRDLFIVIFAIIGIGATILLAILFFLVFRKIRSILDSGRDAVDSVRKISSLVSHSIAKPLIGIASFLQGLRQASEFCSKSSRKKEGKSSEREE